MQFLGSQESGNFRSFFDSRGYMGVSYNGDMSQILDCFGHNSAIIVDLTGTRERGLYQTFFTMLPVATALTAGGFAMGTGDDLSPVLGMHIGDQ